MRYQLIFLPLLLLSCWLLAALQCMAALR